GSAGSRHRRSWSSPGRRRRRRSRGPAARLPGRARLECACTGHYTAAIMVAANFERLREEAAHFGLMLEPRHLDQFRSYLDLLLDWNRKINLTAITDPEQVLDKHCLDSLAAAPLIPAGRLVDVGAGAGFPGIPIAIVRPDVQVSLLESTGKKAAF